MNRNFKISIDKSVVSEMPRVTFGGDVYVIDTMLKVNAAVAILRKSPIVGFDSETRPAFRKGQSHKVALLQLSTHDECFLFRTNKIGVPLSLADYLADSRCLKIGLSLHDDFNQLHKISSLMPAGFVDLQSIVGDYHIADISLQKIYAILFQQKISKGQRLTNWEADTLTDAQQQYAAIDAWACIRIYEYLKSGNYKPEESPYIAPSEDEKSE